MDAKENNSARHDYIQAFRKANPSEPAPKIWYCGGGWYAIQDFGSSARPASYRLKQIIEMTARLEARAQHESP